MNRKRFKRKRILFSVLLLFSFIFGLFPGASRGTEAVERIKTKDDGVLLLDVLDTGTDFIDWTLTVNGNNELLELNEVELNLSKNLSFDKILRSSENILNQEVNSDGKTVIKMNTTEKIESLSFRTILKDKTSTDFTVAAFMAVNEIIYYTAESVVLESKVALEMEEPVVEGPVVEEPVVEKPVIEEPVVEEPVIEKPVVEEPVVEEPVIEKPVVEEPVIEKPVVEEPVIEKPVVEEPMIEKPVVEEPMIEKPVVEEPVVEEPQSNKENLKIPIEEPMQDLMEIVPLALAGPGVYTIDTSTSIVKTELTGSSINDHTVPSLIWSKSGIVYVAVKSTHILKHLVLGDYSLSGNTKGEPIGNGIKSTTFDEYNPGVYIKVDGIDYLPEGLQGNTGDAHWTVFKFNLSALYIPTDGIIKFYVKGIGGGHDVYGDMKAIVSMINITGTKQWIGGPDNKPSVKLQLWRYTTDINNTQINNLELAYTGIVDGLDDGINLTGYESPGWAYNWIEVPEFSPFAQKYVYIVDEESNSNLANYEKTFSEDRRTVINTYRSPLINITGTKQWVGGSDRPSVNLQLLRYLTGANISTALPVATGIVDGTIDVNPINPNRYESPGWTYNWKQMPQFDNNGVAYIYIVDEESNPNLANYEKTFSEDRRTVINTYKLTEVVVKKLVDGNLGDKTKEFTFTATLPQGSEFPDYDGPDYIIEQNRYAIVL